jgi:lipopolysaccharide exporter
MIGLRGQAEAGVRWTGLSSATNVITDIVRIVVLARFLSPVDYGLMAMVWLVIGLSQIYIDLGVSAAVIHRPNNSKKQLSSLYWLNILAGLGACGLVSLCAPWVSMIFREPSITLLLRVTALVFLIVPIGSQFEILLQKELMFKVLARWEMVASAAGTIVALALAISGFGVWTLVWSFLTSVTLKTFLLARVGFVSFPPSLHFRYADLKGYIGFGLFQLGERSINYLAEKLDQLLIGPLLGAEALGFYNFALYLTSQPGARINPILTKVAFPVFSKVQNEPARLQRGYIKLLTLLTTVNAPLLIGLAAVAPWAVPVIFGAKWTSSVLLVQILSFVSLSRSIGNPIGSLQLAKGRADLGFWWNMSLFACSVPAIYVGGKIGGAIGVAVSLLILQICLNIPSYLFMVRPLIGKCARVYILATLKPVVLAFVMGLAVTFLPVFSPSLDMRTELASRIALGALVYFGLLFILDRRVIADFQSALVSVRSAS